MHARIPPPGKQTPPEAGTPPPHGSRHPPEADLPQGSRSPRHTVNERPVRILLECILVFQLFFCCAKSSWCYLLQLYEDITHAMHFLSYSVQRADASRFQNGSILPGIFFTIMQNKHFNEARWKEQLID